MTVHIFTPRDGAFVRELLGPKLAETIPEQTERYTLRAWADGYEILEWDRVISTFHGECWDRASRHYRRLVEAARNDQTPKDAA